MAGIERVVYRSRFVKRLRESRRLPAITFEAADFPEDVVALVDAHLLDLGGTYGHPEMGDPIRYGERRPHPAIMNRGSFPPTPSCANEATSSPV